MRYALYRGLAQVSKLVRLKFAAMNPKGLPDGTQNGNLVSLSCYFLPVRIFFALRPAWLFPGRPLFDRLAPRCQLTARCHFFGSMAY